MSAIPAQRLWTPPRGLTCPFCGKLKRALRRKRDWLRRIIDPIAAYAAGDILLDSSGAVILTAGGDVLLDDGSGNSCCCSTGPGGPWTCGCANNFHFTNVTITFSGLSYISGCFSIGGGQFAKWTGVDLTTYTLTPPDNCITALSTVDSSVFFNEYNNNTCTAFFATAANAHIGFVGGGGAWQVTATLTSFGTFFNGTARTTSCAGGIVVSNGFSGTPTYGANIASGGTATITFS